MNYGQQFPTTATCIVLAPKLEGEACWSHAACVFCDVISSPQTGATMSASAAVQAAALDVQLGSRLLAMLRDKFRRYLPTSTVYTPRGCIGECSWTLVHARWVPDCAAYCIVIGCNSRTQP